jgi:heat-inducible transcriptional repressor
MPTSIVMDKMSDATGRVQGATFQTLSGDLERQGERSREIFRHIVDSYLETGEPVGSRSISRAPGIDLSAASIRNVMSDLEHLGLIFSPHTSAGRLPTELGLRFFVDALMEFGTLSDEERAQVDGLTGTPDDAANGHVEALLTEAGEVLSGLSRGAGVVMAGKQDVRIRHLEFVPLDPGKALLVLVGDNGSVENRLINVPAGSTTASLTEAANYLNAHLRGRTLAETRSEIMKLRDVMRAELAELTQQAVETGVASLAEFGDGQPQTLIVRGQANLLTDVSVNEDLERIQMLLGDLERKNDILDLLGMAEDGDGVRIFIGSDNKLFSLSGSSVVLSPYRDSNRKIIGVLGVIGPTRLNYARIVPMVDYTAQVIGRLVSKGAGG